MGLLFLYRPSGPSVTAPRKSCAGRFTAALRVLQSAWDLPGQRLMRQSRNSDDMQRTTQTPVPLMFEQLGLIGCGLMGGSFALALKRAGLVKRVVGYSKSPSTTERARQMGVIDVEAPSALLAVAGADIVLLAVPVAATEATLKAIRHLVTDKMLIMDVGSTKLDVIQDARRALCE